MIYTPALRQSDLVRRGRVGYVPPLGHRTLRHWLTAYPPVPRFNQADADANYARLKGLERDYEAGRKCDLPRDIEDSR